MSMPQILRFNYYTFLHKKHFYKKVYLKKHQGSKIIRETLRSHHYIVVTTMQRKSS